MCIGRSSCKQDRIGVPCHGCDGTSDWFLQMFRDPPIIFFFKVADCNYSRPRSDCEFLFRRGPSDESRSAVDAEQNERRLPARRRRFPNICITILDACDQEGIQVYFRKLHKQTLRAGHDTASGRSDINACNRFVMSFQLVLKSKLWS